MAADITELLYPCRQALVQAMDPETTSAWRLVNTRACLDVYESTHSLTWRTAQHDVNNNAGPAQTPSALPLPLLSKCPGLKKLQCGGMISLQSLDALPQGLQLEVLDLNLTEIRGCLDFSPLTRCCTPEGRHTLQKLDLGNNLMGPEGAALLAPALEALTGLQRLSLWCNTVRAQGAAALAPALQALTGLQRLNLGANNLGVQGAAALVPALQALTGLQRLALGGNDLGPEGVATLAPALLALTGLQQLDLQFNDLGPESAAALVPALTALTGLQQLDLRANSLNPQSAAPLIHALQEHNPRLQIII